MKNQFTFLLFLLAICFNNIHLTAQNYHVGETEKIRRFLQQDSGESGKTNADMLGITNLNDPSTWNLNWKETQGEYHLKNADWSGKQLGGDLDFSGFTELDTLNCGYNNLSSLNLDDCVKLQCLNCYTNDFSSIGIRNCPLTYINCSANKLTKFNFSQYPALEQFIGTQNHITQADISVCPNLKVFMCGNSPLEKIDLSQNKKLVNVQLMNTSITSLDASNLPELEELWCYDGEIRNLNVDGSPKIKVLHATKNRLDFNTLPAKPENCGKWGYSYAPQKKIEFPAEVPALDPIDLSYLACEGKTVYTWLYAKNDEAVPQTEYTASEGVFTFVRPLSQAVYCQMTHPDFPDLAQWDALKTTSIKITKAVPVTYRAEEVAQLKNFLAQPSALEGKTNAEALDITDMDDPSTWKTIRWVKSGHEYLAERIDWSAYELNGELVLTDFAALDTLNCNGNSLTSLNVAGCGNLRQINCYSNKLILFKAENCPLTYLHCGMNQLKALDICQFPEMEQLYCPDNQISTLDFTGCPELAKVVAGKNPIQSVDLHNNLKLENLQLIGTSISRIDASNLPRLKELWCNSCQLTEVDIENSPEIEVLNLQNNYLHFGTLPGKPALSGTWGYTYAPQKNIQLEEEAAADEAIDLGYLYCGRKTTFNWLYASNGKKVPDTEYTAENGKFTFKNKQPDKVYCEMTNTDFPDFTKSDVLKTTEILIGESHSIGKIPSGKRQITLSADGNTCRITPDGDIRKITVTGADGRVVLETRTKGNTFQTTQLPGGVYYLILTTDKGTETHKIMK